MTPGQVSRGGGEGPRLGKEGMPWIGAAPALEGPASILLPAGACILLQLGLSCGQHRLVVPAEVGDGVGSGRGRLSSSRRSPALHKHEGLAVSEQRPGPCLCPGTLTACSRAPGGRASRAATSSSSRTSPGRGGRLRVRLFVPSPDQALREADSQSLGLARPKPSSQHPPQ